MSERKSVVGSMISNKNTAITPVDKKEARSKRVNLLVKPSVYDLAKKKCEELDISLNECINQFLEKWCED